VETWGWNPSTLEALATAVAALFAFIAVIVARRSLSATRAEINDRMRPWVGLYGFDFYRDKTGTLRLTALMKNCGPLPALRAHLTIEIKPLVLEEVNEIVNAVILDWPEQKTLVPGEDGNYGDSLPSATHPEVEKWIAAKRDLVANGTFTYVLGERKFESKFIAELWFRSKPKPENRLVKINWRNTSAT